MSELFEDDLTDLDEALDIDSPESEESVERKTLESAAVNADARRRLEALLAEKKLREEIEDYMDE
jgi:hypothetical protein